MMTDSYYAGVYWSGRVESAQQCAQRAETFFRLLSGCDTIYERWFKQANSLKRALQLQFEPTSETFVRFFSKKKHQLIEGFSLGAWTGHREDGRGGIVSLTCGTDCDSFCNNCLLYLPTTGPEVERVLTVPVLTQVFRAMVLAWEPDWGVILSDELLDTVSRPRDVGTFVGWLTYFSQRRGQVPPLPGPVRSEPIEDKGTLLILTPERLSASNAEHVALAARSRELLASHEGLLAPILSPPQSPGTA
jgi:hypothetical protein